MLPEEEFASVQEQFKNEVAGLGALRTPEGLLPLKAVRLEATLVGFSSLWVLQQTFQNTSQTSLEAIYIFPLPERGAVQKFEMRIGERVIQGTLLERASARLKYRNALEKGHQAAITEEERPGVFT
ncbi:MAG TPA: VIT domain-containing protein, partial [Gemmatales bacterium]|nr:VIT domain-containing protein [Gemmatales bacterium]